MTLSYGAGLRHQREQYGVTLAAIAERTKIKVSLLEALERDDVSAWPAGIFRRSYFRAYAQAIGLDPDAAVREFLERHPDPFEEFAEALGARGSERPGSRAVTRLRYLIDSAVGAIPALRPPPAAAPPPADPRQERRLEPTPIGVPAPPLAERQSVESADVPPPRDLNAHVRRWQRPAADPQPAGLDFTAIARLCTRLAQSIDARDVAPVFADVVKVLDAVGVILWAWDPRSAALGVAIAHGYSDDLLRQLPRVPAESEAAIAAAFRSGEARVVDGHDAETGAIVVPLLTASGCGGVLALEFAAGREQPEPARAAATILAAQLAALVGGPALAHAATA